MVNLLRTSPTGAQIGIEDDTWVVETGRGRIALDQPLGSMASLPLLERSYSQVHQEVREALERHAISSDFASAFPAQAIVSYALSTASAYWKQQAFRWLEEIPPSAETTELLKKISEERRWPQQLRHGAQRLLERCH